MIKYLFSLILVLLIIATSINCQTQQQGDQSTQLTSEMPSQSDFLAACPFRRCCPRFRQCPRNCPYCPFRQLQMQT